MKRAIAVASWILALAATAGGMGNVATASSDAVVIRFDNAAIYRDTRAALHDRGLWVERLSDHRMKVPARDVSAVRKAITEVVAKRLGENAATYPDRQFERVRSRLEEAGVEHQVRCYASTRWLVWSEDSGERVDDLIASVGLEAVEGVDPPAACDS